MNNFEVTITLPETMMIAAGGFTQEEVLRLDAGQIAELVKKGLSRLHQEAGNKKTESENRKARQKIREKLQSGTYYFDSDLSDAMVAAAGTLFQAFADKMPKEIRELNATKRRHAMVVGWMREQVEAAAFRANGGDEAAAKQAAADKINAIVAKEQAKIDAERERLRAMRTGDDLSAALDSMLDD